MKKWGLMAAAAAMTASSAFAADGIEINKFLTLGGFVDVAYLNTSVDNPGGTSVDTATFAMQQAEMDFSLNLGEGLSARIDVQAGTDTNQNGNSSGTTTDYADIEQARIDLDLGTWGVTFGKFDTYIGLEGLEPTDLYQNSSSLSAELAPTQQTGINFNFKGEMFSADLGIVNGMMAENPDINDEMAYQVHVGVTPWEAWAFNLSYATANEATGATTSGKVAAGADVDVSLLAADIQYQNYGFTVGFEYASQDIDVTGATAESTAMELMVNYKFNEQFSLTGRYSTVEGKLADMSEFTLAPIVNLTPNWSAMLEYRSESGAGTVTRDFTPTGIGGGQNDASQIALKTTLSF